MDKNARPATIKHRQVLNFMVAKAGKTLFKNTRSKSQPKTVTNPKATMKKPVEEYKIDSLRLG
jgi:hypothetical protein